MEYYLEYKRKTYKKPAIFKATIKTKLVLLENVIGFDIKASFASRPVSRLIR